MIKAVMFDFSQTLFRSESTGTWLDVGLSRTGLQLPTLERDALVGRLMENGAMPGGPEPRRLPDELRLSWDQRDLSAESHRAAYEGLMRVSAIPIPELAQVLYNRHTEPAAWRPYPDTESTLRELRRCGVPVAVVSNIGWNMRPIFRRFDLHSLIDVFVLSYEHGVQKPDPAIFRKALNVLGTNAPQTLMVGDNLHADGAATALGCIFHHVAPTTIEERPDALAAVLNMIG
jgi:putative hydrolase of the HAD superfamily